MNIIEKYIKELQEYEITSEENNSYNNTVPIQDAIDILQRFEIELINEMSCEELEKLKLEKWI